MRKKRSQMKMIPCRQSIYTPHEIKRIKSKRLHVIESNNSRNIFSVLVAIFTQNTSINFLPITISSTLPYIIKLPEHNQCQNISMSVNKITSQKFWKKSPCKGPELTTPCTQMVQFSCTDKPTYLRRLVMPGIELYKNLFTINIVKRVLREN